MSEFEETKIIEKDFEVIIPECCREGWDDCPHVTPKFQKTKTNIGL